MDSVWGDAQEATLIELGSSAGRAMLADARAMGMDLDGVEQIPEGSRFMDRDLAVREDLGAWSWQVLGCLGDVLASGELT